MKGDSCWILSIKELVFLKCLRIVKEDNVGLSFCLFPVFHPRFFAVWPHRNRKSFTFGYFFCHTDYRVAA
jgi:hypothetical protein